MEEKKKEKKKNKNKNKNKEKLRKLKNWKVGDIGKKRKRGIII
jgi:hypothetical protein